MKKLIIGLALAGAGMYLYKLKQQGKLDDVCDDMHMMKRRLRKKIKNAVAVGKNEMEYLRESAGEAIDKIKK